MMTRRELAIGTGAVLGTGALGAFLLLGADAAKNQGKEELKGTLTAGAPTETHTPSPTATEGRVIDPAILVNTETPTSSPTIETATPVPATVTKTEKTGKGASEGITAYLVSPDLKFAVNENGVARVDMEAFKKHLAQVLPSETGVTTSGKAIGVDSDGRRDVVAETLGTSIKGKKLTTSHVPNFWERKEGGLGWTTADVGNIFTDMNALRAHVKKNGLNAMFSEGKDGIKRVAVRVEQKDFESAVATIAVGLNTSGNKQAIWTMTDTLLDSTGYRPVERAKESWPKDPKVFLEKDVDFLGDGDVCVTWMQKAENRSAQNEVVTNTVYRDDVEEKDSKNNETLNKSDADGDILIVVTSESTTGNTRLDGFRMTNIPDVIAKRVVPVEDKAANTLPIETDGGRWVPCGNGPARRGVTPTLPPKVSVPGQPEVQKTPSKPGETPHNPDKTPTPPPKDSTFVPTNRPEIAPTIVNTPAGNPSPQPAVENTPVPPAANPTTEPQPVIESTPVPGIS